MSKSKKSASLQIPFYLAFGNMTSPNQRLTLDLLRIVWFIIVGKKYSFQSEPDLIMLILDDSRDVIRACTFTTSSGSWPLSDASSVTSCCFILVPNTGFYRQVKTYFPHIPSYTIWLPKKGSINCLKIQTEPVLLGVYLIVFQGCKYYGKTISCDFLTCFFYI